MAPGLCCALHTVPAGGPGLLGPRMVTFIPQFQRATYQKQVDVMSLVSSVYSV